MNVYKQLGFHTPTARAKRNSFNIIINLLYLCFQLAIATRLAHRAKHVTIRPANVHARMA